MSRILPIAGKTTKELLRDRRRLGLTLGLPIVFMLIFGAAFGGARSETTYPIAVLDEDTGTQGGQYVELLRGLKYDSGRAVADVRMVESLDAGLTQVRERDVAALVVIPSGFTGAVNAARQGQTRTATVDVHGDPGYASYNVAAQVVQGSLDGFVQKASGRPPAVGVASKAVVSSQLTPFDFIAPGLMVFAMLNLAPQSAAILAREAEQRTLERLKLTRMSALDLVAGVSLAQLLFAVVAVLLMFGTALLMGFHNQGSLLVAMGISLVAAVAVIGIGMVISAFATRQDDAANIGVAIAVPGSFLSGAFFPIPEVGLFRFGDRLIQLYDVLPTTHAVRALRSVLTLGDGVGTVVFELGAMALLSLAFFATGVTLFARRRLAAV